MGWKDVLDERLDSVLAFGIVTTTVIAAGAQSVLAAIRGDEDDAGDEESDDAELWGHAPLLYRPADPDADGACEALFVRWGDDREVIATKDRRWQISLEKGDVCVRNLSGANPVRLRLQADGVAILEANEVRIGDSGATNTIALGDVIANHLASIKSWMDSHTHVLTIAAQAGAGGTGTAAPPTPSSPSVPDVQSRHKVEN